MINFDFWIFAPKYDYKLFKQPKLRFTFRSFGISPYFTIQNMLGHPVWIPRMQSFFVTIAKILLGNYSDGSWNIGNNWNVLIHQFLALVCQAWGFWESLLSNIKGRMSDKTCSFYLHSCRTPQVCCTLPAPQLSAATHETFTRLELTG